MLKMYNTDGKHGGESVFWDEVWSTGNFEMALRFCDVDPLRPLFERYVRPGSLMLEGGCGLGQYVAYYSARGARVVGLDFARETLSALRDRSPGLDLCAGDVAALPFHDGQFDAYYSGGVVEHFEGGPGDALREAWRVVRPGGVLLVSVPYLSPLRRITSLLRRSDRTYVSEPHTDSGEAESNDFFQYAFSSSEFEELLTRAGFRVVSKQGYAILFGLYELPLLAKLVAFVFGARSRLNRGRNYGAKLTMRRSEGSSNGRRGGTLKRLLVNEDVSVPVAGGIVRFLRWTCAHMQMYVCVRT